MLLANMFRCSCLSWMCISDCGNWNNSFFSFGHQQKCCLRSHSMGYIIQQSKHPYFCFFWRVFCSGCHVYCLVFFLGIVCFRNGFMHSTLQFFSVITSVMINNAVAKPLQISHFCLGCYVRQNELLALGWCLMQYNVHINWELVNVCQVYCG